ncbi:MAG: lysylphosphatidylglycerol synthase transmembrane domain-containing protein [Nitrospiraceae bacterium]|nr:lysylphosphatidylglycerol synthase transmembrane domain-containing protein [Nitrospiraceae bacterium]
MPGAVMTGDDVPVRGKGRRGTLKKPLFFILKLSVSSALLYLVLHRAGVQNVISAIIGINPAFFLAAMALYIAGTFVSSIRWRLFVESGPPLRRFFSLYLLGCFFSTFLPGLFGGDAVKGYYLYKETGKTAEAMASSFMDRYLGLAALLVMASLVYPLGLPHLRAFALTLPGGQPVRLRLSWLLPALVAGFLAASLAFFKLRPGRGRIKLLADFYGQFGLYGRKAVVNGVLLSFGVQALSVISVCVLARGLGINVPLPLFFIFVPLIALISAIPVSVSGIGIREASFVLLFGAVGVNPRTATALSFAWYLSYSAASLTGLYEYLKIKRG